MCIYLLPWSPILSPLSILNGRDKLSPRLRDMLTTCKKEPCLVPGLKINCLKKIISETLNNDWMLSDTRNCQYFSVVIMVMFEKILLENT